MPAKREKKSFLLRIDPDLWADLEALASADLRSVNGQVEFLLRDAVRRRIGGVRRSSEDDVRSNSPIPRSGAPSDEPSA